MMISGTMRMRRIIGRRIIKITKKITKCVKISLLFLILCWFCVIIVIMYGVENNEYSYIMG